MGDTAHNSTITIIDAHWEERNIGYKATEIELFADSDRTSIETIQEIQEGLVTIKLPVSRIDLVHQLETLGYNYIENQIVIEKRLSLLKGINSLYTNIAIDFHPVGITTEADKALLIDEVGKGMFDTDRFTVDPLFGKNVSSKRFVNWVKDLFEKEAVCTTLVKNKETNEAVSFIITDYSKKHPHGVLGGAFSASKKSGVSHLAIYFALQEAQQKGYKRFRTAISSNNIGIFNIYSSIFSFNIIDTKIVLRKLFR